MIEIHSMPVEKYSFLGIYMQLPQYPIYLLVSMHVILAPICFSKEYFNCLDKKVAVILVKSSFSFESLLECEIVSYNDFAQQIGVTAKMKGKEALLLCEKSTHKKI